MASGEAIDENEIMEILGAGNGAAVDLSDGPAIESAEEEMERLRQQRAQKRKARNEKLRQRMQGKDGTSMNCVIFLSIHYSYICLSLSLPST